MSRRRPAALMLFLAAVLVVTLPGCRRRGEDGAGLSSPAPDDPGATVARLPYSFVPSRLAKLIKTITPAVVHLSADAPVRGGPADWFGAMADPLSPASPMAGWHDRFAKSLGSGVIVDREGHILTNNHVIGPQDQVWAHLPNGDRLSARLIGRDPQNDLALLRLQTQLPAPIKHALSGESDRLEVGDWVVAVANPLGLGPHATTGIVSAVPSKQIDLSRHGLWGFVQTDMRIHAGNSGGAVVNAAGELVGIATAVREETAGVGFVLPIDTARQVLPDLKRDGRVRRSWAGMYIEPVTDETAFKAGLTEVAGGLVSGVVPGGPAETGGLRKGDIIVTFDGQAISSGQQLSWLVASAGVGRKVGVQVWRAGKKLELFVQMQPMPE